MTYKKNDIVKFLTSDPAIHIMEMFGHCRFNPDEIERDEYIGRVKSVIGGGKSLLISSIAPLKGFICIADACDILACLDESELNDDQRATYRERYEHMEAPNVYDNDPSQLDDSLSVDQRCEAVARKAIFALFPDTVIKAIKPDNSLFQTETYIADLDYCLDHFTKDKSSRRRARLKKRRDQLENWFRTLRFKEYYTVNVWIERTATEEEIQFNKEIYEDIAKHLNLPEESVTPSKTITVGWLVAIDKEFRETVILRDGEERSRFFLFLGPEHDLLYEAKMDFASQCFKKEKRK